jgi:hypothetical protein
MYVMWLLTHTLAYLVFANDKIVSLTSPTMTVCPSVWCCVCGLYLSGWLCNFTITDARFVSLPVKSTWWYQKVYTFFCCCFFAFWTMHFVKVNEKPTNSSIIQCISTQYADGWDIPTVTLPLTRYSSHPSMLPTTFGTYLSRIMFDSLIMEFWNAETCRRIMSTNT